MKLILSNVATVIITLILSYFLLANNGQQIFVADFSEIKKAITANIVADKNYQFQIENHLIDQKIKRFEVAVEEISRKENTIIIDKRAILGSPVKDVTKELQQLVNDINK